MENKNQLKKSLCIMSLIFIVGIILIAYISGVFSNKGYYSISDMWIGSNDSQNITYCDECLWIKFYEGCNRYKTYYFEEQHELDYRLEIGMPVDIFLKEVNGKYYIKEVIPRKELFARNKTKGWDSWGNEAK